MDSWPRDQHRHKRPFDEMSQPASLSPSPFFFGHPQPPPPPFETAPNNYERRRTSHPHNPASHSSFPSQDIMAEPRHVHRPSLEHRTSQTIIDLTDDADQPSVGASNARYVQRPPQLGRSDALALEDIIDLTEDIVDDDLEIIDARQIFDFQPPVPAHTRLLPQPRPRIRLERDQREDNNAFFPHDLPDPRRMDRDMGSVGRGVARGFLTGGSLAGLGEMAGRLANLIPQWGVDEHLSFFVVGGNQGMPDLDYRQHAFARPRQQAKPQHQPPPPPKPGFTRSPAEEDVVICPACQNELVAKKSEEEPVLKKSGGRQPTKKDREEHPFWVVKDCGHVYCNRCYQGRRADKRKPSTFPEKANPTGKTVPICAVEGCEKDVGDKKHWVGVFI